MTITAIIKEITAPPVKYSILNSMLSPLPQNVDIQAFNGAYTAFRQLVVLSLQLSEMSRLRAYTIVPGFYVLALHTYLLVNWVLGSVPELLSFA